MTFPSYIKQCPRGLLLHIKVTPKSKKLGILGQADGMLRVSLKSVPADGKSNLELVLFLSGRSQKKERTFRNIVNLNVYEKFEKILSQRMS